MTDVSNHRSENLLSSSLRILLHTFSVSTLMAYGPDNIRHVYTRILQSYARSLVQTEAYIRSGCNVKEGPKACILAPEPWYLYTHIHITKSTNVSVMSSPETMSCRHM